MAISVRNLAICAAAAFAVALACLALGPIVSDARAGSACTRYGGVKPTRLHVPQARRAVLCLVNRKRRQHHLGRLRLHRRVRHAAQNHTDAMLNRHCYSHQCAGERDLVGRLQKTGYIHGGLRRWACAENIDWGMRRSGTPKAVVRGWMHSSEHRSRILSRTFEDAGVGFVKGSPSKKSAKAGIYTLDFGMREG